MWWSDLWAIRYCRKTFLRIVSNFDQKKLTAIERVIKTGKQYSVLTHEAAFDELYRMAKRYGIAFNDTMPTEYLLKPVRRAIKERLRQL